MQVVDGVIHFVSHLKGLFKGRYADVNRQDYQAVLVRYYSDNTRHWHRRFMMEHYDKKKSPLLVQAAACAPPPGGRDGAWPVLLAAAGREGVEDVEFLLTTKHS